MELKTVYCYDQNGVYLGIGDSQEDQMNKGAYLLPPNSTCVKPPDYDQSIEFLVFDGDEWGLLPLVKSGTYYP